MVITNNRDHQNIINTADYGIYFSPFNKTLNDTSVENKKKTKTLYVVKLAYYKL